MKFNSRKLKDLNDGKNDEDGLNVLFTTLGFNVIVHQNNSKCNDVYSGAVQS